MPTSSDGHPTAPSRPPGPRHWIPAAAAVSAAAWGANQFAPLAIVYRTRAHWAAFPVTVMFSAYVVGLIAGLPLGVTGAARHGRRIVRPALLLSATASAALALAPLSQLAVYLGRLAAGVAAGVIFAAGTAWVGELSARPSDRHPGQDTGARRATLATGAGYSAGGLTTGALAQWLPLPAVLPCLVHVVLALTVLAALRNVPETLGRRPSRIVARGGPSAPAPVTGSRPRTAPVAARHPRFLRVVLPAAPAVFGAASVAYVVLPPLVADQVPGYAPLFSGLVTGVTLAMGVAVQPLARRLDHAGSARATLVAIGTVIAGLLTGAAAARLDSPALVLPAAVLLGSGYGLTLASGLLEIARLAPPSAVRRAVHVYQGSTYLGLFTPLLLTTAVGWSGGAAGGAAYALPLAALAVLGGLSLAVAALHSRRHLPGSATAAPGALRAADPARCAGRP